MDLTEVEGLADLIAADTAAQRKQVRGGAVRCAVARFLASEVDHT